jgi:predicted DNA-binding transcriptional regulator YafY
MDPRLRRDQVVRQLRRQGLTSVDELAHCVGASRRTILRDIAALRAQGFTIDSESGKGGGVVLDPTSVQLATRLSASEVFALLISVAVTRATQSAPFSGLADSGMRKLESALPPLRVREFREILGRLAVGPPAAREARNAHAAFDPSLLPAFEASFLRRRRLRFDYMDKAQRRSAREVEPQGILVLPPIWYLVAHDCAKSAFRHFRMDRIKAPEIIEGGSFRLRAIPKSAGVCPFDFGSNQRAWRSARAAE